MVEGRLVQCHGQEQYVYRVIEQHSQDGCHIKDITMIVHSQR